MKLIQSRIPYSCLVRASTEVSVALFAAVATLACAPENVSAETSGGKRIAEEIVSDDAGSFSVSETTVAREFRTIEREPIVEANDDPSCTKKLPKNLRELFYENFRHAIDVKGSAHVGEPEIARYAKVLGMAPRESGGATVAVSDMKANGSRATFRRFYDVENPGRRAPSPLYSSVEGIEVLYATKGIKWDRQLNFGLLQMSADRMATRYRGSDRFSAGTMDKLRTLYLSHPEEVLERCGTRRMFQDSDATLRKAFEGLQSCEPGYTTKEKVQCFGRWVMLCPNLNVDLALIAPPAYFSTRNAPSLCAKTFRKILKEERSRR